MNEDIKLREKIKKIFLEEEWMYVRNNVFTKLLSLIYEVSEQARKEGYEEGFENGQIDMQTIRADRKKLVPLNEEAVRNCLIETHLHTKTQPSASFEELAHAIVQKFGKEGGGEYTDRGSGLPVEQKPKNSVSATLTSPNSASDYEWVGKGRDLFTTGNSFISQMRNGKLADKMVHLKITVKEVK